MPHAHESKRVIDAGHRVAAGSEIGIPLGVVQRDFRQPRSLLARRGLAGLNGIQNIAEIRRRIDAKLRSNQHVAFTEPVDLPQRLLADQYRQHLLRYRDGGVEIVSLVERKFHVDRDDDVDPHLLHDVDRQVTDNPTVNQQVAVEANRREGARDRHACPDRCREVAVTHDVDFAALDVGGDRAKGNRQLVEIVDMGCVQRQFPQQQVQTVPLDDTRR